MALDIVKSQHILKNGIIVHKSLTVILLTSKTALTSKGKCLKPSRLLEKELKSAIRNFQLAVDLLANSDDIQGAQK